MIGCYRKYADRFGYRPLGYDKIAHYASARFDLGEVRIAPEPSVSTRAESSAASASELIWVMAASGDSKNPRVEWAAQPVVTAL